MLSFEKTYPDWTFERIARHVFYWLAWLIFYATVNSSYYDESFWTWIEVELFIMPIKLPYTYFVIYYLVPNYLIKKDYSHFFFWAISLAIIGGIGIRSMDGFYIAPNILNTECGPFWTFKISYKVVDLIYIASLPTVLKLIQRNFQHEQLHKELAEQKLQAELQNLKNQLQPHFLFNTLNNLYGMVLTTDKKAPDVVLRLSNMMSYMLYECQSDWMPLDKEIANLKNYIELEKIRYDDRLDISFEVGGAVDSVQITPLLFIPFVENAFKHGPAKNEQLSWIRMHLFVNENELDFMIENSLSEDKLTESGSNQSGIGLKNVRKRLELIYPAKHELIIENGTTHLVRLKIKL